MALAKFPGLFGSVLWGKRVKTMALLSVIFIFAGALALPIPALGSSREMATLSLPAPATQGTLSLEEALSQRHSVRALQSGPLNLMEVAQLLWAAQGMTARSGKRTAPSAGALYPLRLYLVAGAVEGLAPGVYRYDPARHRLQRITSGDQRAVLAAAALGQRWIRDNAAVLVIAAVYERTTGKYGERGVRYVHMEAGHVAQNVLLQATALNLGMVPVGAFRDKAVADALHLSSPEQPLYLLPVGRKE